MITNFKTYESYESRRLVFNSYKKGDFIVLTKFNEYSQEREFVVGDVYKIYMIDNDSEEFRIHNNRNDRDVWVTVYEVRKAEPYDIELNKYNL